MSIEGLQADAAMARIKAIEKIRAACIEANPEIVELKFGCSVQLRCGEWENYVVLQGVGKCTRHKRMTSCEERDCYYEGYVEDAWWLYHEDDENMHEKSVLKTEPMEIIGRPIRLDDLRPTMNEDKWLVVCTMWASGLLDSQEDKTLLFICENQY